MLLRPPGVDKLVPGPGTLSSPRRQGARRRGRNTWPSQASPSHGVRHASRGHLRAALVATALQVVVARTVGSCTGEHPHGARLPTASSPPESRLTQLVTPGAGTCPVTIPAPVPRSHAWRTGLFGWGSAHGNGQLWVGGLDPQGVLRLSPDAQGRFVTKLGWWREVAGRLRIMGRRLDVRAPPMRAQVPGGYGRSGFQSSGVDFPTKGCWEVTGRVEGASLTFITEVTCAVPEADALGKDTLQSPSRRSHHPGSCARLRSAPAKPSACS